MSTFSEFASVSRASLGNYIYNYFIIKKISIINITNVLENENVI